MANKDAQYYIIYKEDTSSLYTNTLYFIYLSSCDDKYRC